MAEAQRNARESDIFKKLKYQDRALKAIEEFEEQLKEWEGDEYANSENREKLGQFYTPPDLAGEMIEMLLKSHDATPEELEEYLKSEPVFDPTAGSGNLSAAEWAYGWDPKHIYANELDPDIVEKRLKPRFKKLGIPRENVFPWPVHTRKYGKMGDEIPEERIKELYNEFAEANPDKYTKQTKGKNKGEWKPKEKSSNTPDFKGFKEQLWAGNILNSPYTGDIFKFVDHMDDVRDVITQMFEAEDAGDIAKADKLYKQALDRIKNEDFAIDENSLVGNEGDIHDKLENAIEEHPEAAEAIAKENGLDDLAEEASQITDDNPHNDEVKNEVVEAAVKDLANPEEKEDVLANYTPSSRKTYENLLNNYKDYIYKSPAEFANWPLQRTENDYIRNQLDEMLPSSVLDLLAMRRWDSEGHDPNETVWSPHSQYYDFALEDALANTGLQWNGEKFLPGSDDQWESNITWEDIAKMDQDTKSKLTDYVLDHYAGDVEDLMSELPEMMKEWKYDWATKKGDFKGSWDDFIRSFYPTEEDKLYDKLQEEYPETNPGDSMFGRSALMEPSQANETPIETSGEVNEPEQPTTDGEQSTPQSNDTPIAVDDEIATFYNSLPGGDLFDYIPPKKEEPKEDTPELSDAAFEDFVNLQPQTNFDKLSDLDKEVVRDYYTGTITNPDWQFVSDFIDSGHIWNPDALQGEDADKLANLFTQYMPSATKGTLGGYKRLNERGKQISRTFEDGATEPEAFNKLVAGLLKRIPKKSVETINFDPNGDFSDILTEENRNKTRQRMGLAVENAIENKELLPEDIPNEELKEEAEQVGDGDKRTDEVNNKAIDDTLPDEMEQMWKELGEEKQAEQEAFDRGEWTTINGKKVKVYKPGEDPYSKVDDGVYDPRIEENEAHEYPTGVGAPGVQTQKDEDFAGPDELPDIYRQGKELSPIYGEGLPAEQYEPFNNMPDPYDHEVSYDITETRQPGEMPEYEPNTQVSLNLGKFSKSNPVDIHTTSTGGSNLNSNIQMPRKVGGSMLGRANIPSLGSYTGGGSVHAPSAYPNNASKPRMDSTYSRASKAPIPPKENKITGVVRGGSNNNRPSSNGSISSGPGMLFAHTSYLKQNGLPKLDMPGHTSTGAGTVSLNGVSAGGNKQPDMRAVLLQQLEQKLFELGEEQASRLGFGHKYKHWTYKNVNLDELPSQTLNELLKLIS